MKTLLRMSGAALLLAVGVSAAASGPTVEQFSGGRNQDEELILPQGGRDARICRYRSFAGNCLRSMLAEPSDCLFVKSPKAGVAVHRPHR